MAYNAIVYRILIASPGDVDAERKLIPELIYKWNASYSVSTNVVLLPVKWETHAVPEMGGRPQAIINKQLVHSCDILIGTFWTRLGTHTGVADSGTLEEIQEFAQQGKPVALFFSSQVVQPDRVDWDQYRKLTEYKGRFKQAGLIGEYSTLEEYEELVNRTLHGFVQTLLAPTMQAKDQQNTNDELRENKQNLRRQQIIWRNLRSTDPYSHPSKARRIFKDYEQLLLDLRVKIEGTAFEGLAQQVDGWMSKIAGLLEYRVNMADRNSLVQFWSDADTLVEEISATVQQV
ncbi:DUF4062 domain-containing protein [Alicyclobacillus fodiniaquatilis]|uniref:DUF4062 domain-containing protein n=1 Tax=Alicyclobacillus fodiniaquatilis TaxID=1661150 RepID=A0ABW4JID1_9BACL